MLHIPPTNSLLLTAKQKPYKKAYLLTKNIEEFSGKSLEERASRRKKVKTERVTGTREEIAKWYQMTALGFQTGGRHQTFPASLQRRYDVPERIHSDQRRDFESRVVKELCAMYHIKKSRTTPYRPQGNGQCERFNCSMHSLLLILPPEQKTKEARPSNIARSGPQQHAPCFNWFAPHLLLFGQESRLQLTTCWDVLLRPQWEQLTGCGNTISASKRRITRCSTS